MNKLTQVFVTAAVITSATLSAGTAYAQDTKTTPGGRGCMVNNVYYLDGAVYTAGTGDKFICNDGTWVPYFDGDSFPHPCCSKLVDSVRKSVSAISKIFGK